MLSATSDTESECGVSESAEADSVPKTDVLPPQAKLRNLLDFVKKVTKDSTAPAAGNVEASVGPVLLETEAVVHAVSSDEANEDKEQNASVEKPVDQAWSRRSHGSNPCVASSGCEDITPYKSPKKVEGAGVRVTGVTLLPRRKISLEQCHAEAAAKLGSSVKNVFDLLKPRKQSTVIDPPLQATDDDSDFESPESMVKRSAHSKADGRQLTLSFASGGSWKLEKSTPKKRTDRQDTKDKAGVAVTLFDEPLAPAISEPMIKKPKAAKGKSYSVQESFAKTASSSKGDKINEFVVQKPVRTYGSRRRSTKQPSPSSVGDTKEASDAENLFDSLLHPVVSTKSEAVDSAPEKPMTTENKEEKRDLCVIVKESSADELSHTAKESNSEVSPSQPADKTLSLVTTKPNAFDVLRSARRSCGEESRKRKRTTGAAAKPRSSSPPDVPTEELLQIRCSPRLKQKGRPVRQGASDECTPTVATLRVERTVGPRPKWRTTALTVVSQKAKVTPAATQTEEEGESSTEDLSESDLENETKTSTRGQKKEKKKARLSVRFLTKPRRKLDVVEKKRVSPGAAEEEEEEKMIESFESEEEDEPPEKKGGKLVSPRNKKKEGGKRKLATQKGKEDTKEQRKGETEKKKRGGGKKSPEERVKTVGHEDKICGQKEKAGEQKDKAGEQKDKAGEQKDKAGAQKDKAGEQKNKVAEKEGKGTAQKDTPSEKAKPFAPNDKAVAPEDKSCAQGERKKSAFDVLMSRKRPSAEAEGITEEDSSAPPRNFSKSAFELLRRGKNQIEDQGPPESPSSSRRGRPKKARGEAEKGSNANPGKKFSDVVVIEDSSSGDGKPVELIEIIPDPNEDPPAPPVLRRSSRSAAIEARKNLQDILDDTPASPRRTASEGSKGTEGEAKKKDVPLASIFLPRKAKPPKEDPAVTAARKAFLMSGVPDTVLQISQAHTSVQELDFPPFPFIPHVRQLPSPPSPDRSLVPLKPATVAHSPPLPSGRIYAAAALKPILSTEKNVLRESGNAPPDIFEHVVSQTAFSVSSMLCSLAARRAQGSQTLPAPSSPAVVKQAPSCPPVVELSDDEETEVPRRKRKRDSPVKEAEKRRKREAPTEQDFPERKREDGGLWSDRYAPLSLDDVIGLSDDVKTRLMSWLEEWKADEARCGRRRPLSASSWSGSEEEDNTPATLLLLGSPGTGKTTTAQALARSFGMKILELNASSRRNGKVFLQQAREATQSHGVKADTSVALIGSSGKGAVSEGELSSQPLVLLVDEVDVFDPREDAGFLTSLSTLLTSSKRPVILTATSPSVVSLPSPLASRKILAVEIQPPKDEEIAAYLQCVAWTEGCFLPPSVALEVAEQSAGDVRRSLNTLQFNVAALDRSQRKLGRCQVMVPFGRRVCPLLIPQMTDLSVLHANFPWILSGQRSLMKPGVSWFVFPTERVEPESSSRRVWDRDIFCADSDEEEAPEVKAKEDADDTLTESPVRSRSSRQLLNQYWKLLDGFAQADLLDRDSACVLADSEIGPVSLPGLSLLLAQQALSVACSEIPAEENDIPVRDLEERIRWVEGTRCLRRDIAEVQTSFQRILPCRMLFDYELASGLRSIARSDVSSLNGTNRGARRKRRVNYWESNVGISLETDLIKSMCLHLTT